jgi:hypothetical protein
MPIGVLALSGQINIIDADTGLLRRAATAHEPCHHPAHKDRSQRKDGY